MFGWLKFFLFSQGTHFQILLEGFQNAFVHGKMFWSKGQSQIHTKECLLLAYISPAHLSLWFDLEVVSNRPWKDAAASPEIFYAE